MRFPTLIPALTLGLFSSLAAAAQRTAVIYVQPVLAAAPAPAHLATVTYDPYLPSGASVTDFELPDDLPEGVQTLRVGVYDPAHARWASSTSIAAVANFDKGFSPHLILTVDLPEGKGGGDVVSVALKGVRIDAGVTRDFGPQAVVRVVGRGEQVSLGKPVVLSPEGKKVGAQPEEKTFLQKYWWVIGIVVLLTMTGGGGDGK